MNLNLNLHQGPALSQQLNLAPQLLNWLRLLQCPATDLSALVAHELESNPALEAAEPEPATDDFADYGDHEEPGTPDADLEAKVDFLAELESEWRYDRQQTRNLNGASKEDQIERHQFLMDSLVSPKSLQEHLLKQVATLELGEDDMALAQLLVGCIDERGYLESTVEGLADETSIPASQIERVLGKVHQLDPPGIGARDLAECLLLQMDQRDEPAYLPALLVREHLEELADHAYAELALALGLSEDEVRDAADVICMLDPTPGTAFFVRPAEYVSPDVTIRRTENGLVVDLNDDHLPKLQVSSICRQLLADKKMSAADRQYVRSKIRAAGFLIQGLGQRQETLRKVTLEIIRIQRDYLEREEGQLKPLTMAKVASVVSVHETTVSRALAGKYIRTPRGIFEMKHFFRSGYLCSDGTAVTPEHVKALITRAIGGEDETRPLTDLDMVQRFEKEGLRLARRTVAKYRDELGISASKERKRSNKRQARVIHISEAMPSAGRSTGPRAGNGSITASRVATTA